MVFEADFFYNGIERWTLGWPTPNYASAFYTVIVCLLWHDSNNRRTQTISFVLEIACYLIIVKTYSRGGLLAVLICAALFNGLLGYHYVKTRMLLWFLRGTIIFFFVVNLGFLSRLSPSYIVSDASVINRLSLWRSSLEMIAASPFFGWGGGESGRAYMNWFQDVNNTEVYTSPVNAYLHVGVEYGLAMLFLVFFAIFSTALVTWRLARLGDSVATATGVSVLSWAIANIFSTLWIEPALWLIPSLAVLLLFWRAYLHNEVLNAQYSMISFFSVFGALMLTMSLYAIGLVLDHQRLWQVTPVNPNITRLEYKGWRNNDPPRCWHIWSDPAVLGSLPGKELRRWSIEYTVPALCVYSDTPIEASPLVGVDSNVLLIGKHSTRTAQVMARGCRNLWLLHPTGLPPAVLTGSSKPACITSVLLPMIDELGRNALWQQWAEETESTLLFSLDVGIDIRNAWPNPGLDKS